MNSMYWILYTKFLLNNVSLNVYSFLWEVSNFIQPELILFCNNFIFQGIREVQESTRTGEGCNRPEWGISSLVVLNNS